MTRDNTYQKPSLFIGDNEILSDITGSINYNSNSQLHTLNVKITSPELQNLALHNKPVELFLNNGSNDGVPMFRGFINNFVPSDKSINITANDIRIKYAGRKGLRTTLTDKSNYDGFTLGQFLTSFTDDFVSDSSITKDFIRDTDPLVFMTNERVEDKDVYSLALQKIRKAVDTDDFLKPLTHFFDVYNDESVSGIIIKKDKPLTSTPVTTFSYFDGLQSYSFNRRLPANTATFQGREFSYTNKPFGTSSIPIKKQDSPADTRNLALQNILIAQQATDEISINISKGFDIDIGEIVALDVDEEDISGNHRVQGKTITFGNNTACTLKLNKKPPVLTDYLNQ
jgi:hypothetical protein